MEPGSLVSLLLLIVLHALITLAYAALTNTRKPLLREQIESGADSPPRLHITYQFTLLLVRFGIAATAVTGLSMGLADRLNISLNDMALANFLADFVVLLPTALVTLVLGDLVPEAVGSTQADELAPWVVSPVRLLIGLFSPVVGGMLVFSKNLASLFGGRDKVNVVTEEELMTMLDASEKEGSIENEEKEMIYSVLEFGDKVVSEIMVPRIDIVALDIDTPLEAALPIFIQSGHSRIPVYEESVDHIKGLLYAKDLLNFLGCTPPKPIREILRPAFFVPESQRAEILLTQLRSKKIHIALVVDEYGGIAGLVTIEDLIEEIIGDIQDEYDVNEEAEYVQQGPNTYLIDAGISLSDFNNELDVAYSTDDSNTLGGFLFNFFGRVPEVGETIEHGGLTLRVNSLDGRRIRKVLVIRKVAPALEGESQPALKPQTAID